MVQQVCPRCGAWSTRASATPAGPGWADLACPLCGHATTIRHLPLFVLTGASGSGKTATCERLLRTLPECVVLESDVLLATLRSWADEDIRHYWDQWMRLLLQIHQAGRPVLLCGTVMPRHLEATPDRDGIAAIHYLALVCDDGELERRLRARPAWRGCDESFIAGQVAFNRWWRSDDSQLDSVVRLDTTDAEPEETAGRVRSWVQARLGEPAPWY
jgi:broad-specificity NMP kinase